MTKAGQTTDKILAAVDEVYVGPDATQRRSIVTNMKGHPGHLPRLLKV